MIQYIIQAKKSPVDKSVLHYPQVAPVHPVGKEQLAEIINDRCTVTRSDIVAVLTALEDAITAQLMAGNSVRLGDLGSFRPTLQAFGAATAKEAGAQLIRRCRVCFTPSSYLKRKFDLKNLQFAPYIVPKTKPSPGGGGGI